MSTGDELKLWVLQAIRFHEKETLSQQELQTAFRLKFHRPLPAAQLIPFLKELHRRGLVEARFVRHYGEKRDHLVTVRLTDSGHQKIAKYPI